MSHRWMLHFEHLISVWVSAVFLPTSNHRPVVHSICTEFLGCKRLSWTLLWNHIATSDEGPTLFFFDTALHTQHMCLFQCNLRPLVGFFCVQYRLLCSRIVCKRSVAKKKSLKHQLASLTSSASGKAACQIGMPFVDLYCFKVLAGCLLASVAWVLVGTSWLLLESSSLKRSLSVLSQKTSPGDNGVMVLGCWPSALCLFSYPGMMFSYVRSQFDSWLMFGLWVISVLRFSLTAETHIWRLASHKKLLHSFSSA